ncbi:pyridoxal phosphate-dependent aminotransferase [Lachnospiraceae bacterium 29-91]|nr:hypothetical protein C808_03594 [Lachnospiraceae bacterium M18-1]
MQQLSMASDRLMGQPMFQILTKIKEMEREGKDVIHFEIGDPDFDTPDCVIQGAKRALDEGWTHYSSPAGDYELRQAICSSRFFTPRFTPDLDQVVVAPGANPLIYYAVRCLVEPGEEVIIPDPSFSTYQSVLSFAGVNAVRVALREENGFQMLAEDIEEKITDKTRLIIINSPHNPTGAVISSDELKAIGELCLSRGIYLYCDEIYSYLNYTNKTLFSPSELDQCKERTIIATGFSKTFAMTGWRLGIGIGPAELMRKISLLIETTNSCVSTFIQRAGISAIEEGLPDVIRMRDTYKERRDYLVKRLNLIPGIHCIKPEGAFYVFPSIKELNIGGIEFLDRLLMESQVGVCPGEYFGSCGKGYIRLCYATSMDKIKIGMDRMEEFVCKLRKER